MTYRRSLASVLGVAAIPYGMTVVVGCELLLLRHYRGMPDTPRIFAFAGGAIAGYVTAAAFARRALADIEALDARDTVRIGLGHVLAVGTALALGLALSQLHSFAAWPLTAWAGVTSYILLAAVQHLGLRMRD